MKTTSSPSSASRSNARRRALEDPAVMREIFARHLQPPAGRRYDVRECRFSGIRRRDGARFSVQYDLRLADPATGRDWNQVVTGLVYGPERTRRIWDSLREADPETWGAADQSVLPPFAFVPELDMLVQVFPYDVRLPALARMLAGPVPDLVTPILAELGPGEWRLAGWDAAVVRYRADMRASVRLRVQASDAATGREVERRVYAKVYRNAEEGRRLHRAQRELHDAVGTAGVTRLTVAKPIVFEDRLQTLMQEEVSGTSLLKILRLGEDPMPAVRSAARAVAELHWLDVAAPPRPFADEMDRLRTAQDVLKADRPDLAPAVSQIVEAVVAGLDGVAPVLIHGDLKPDHILVDGDRVALIDFDLVGTADPIFDVAHVLAFLSRAQARSLQRRDQEGTAPHVFLEEYFAHAPVAWRARLPLHHAMTSVYKAAGMCRRSVPGREDQIEEVLREGLAFLEDGGDGAVPTFKRRLTRPAVGRVSGRP